MTSTEQIIEPEQKKEINVKSKWDAHPGQEKIRDSDARFRIVACGRRWGKTELASHEIFEDASEEMDRLCWWVAPDYRIADIGFSKVKDLIPPDFIHNIKRTKPKRLDLINGSRIEFRSAGKEDGLVGEGIHSVVIDEASMTPSKAWKKELRPTLSDTMGSMLAISTPKGRNWFHDYYQRGQSDDENFSEVESWSSPTKENPHIPDSEVEAAERELPERIYLQEYEAEFIDDSGGVFEKVRDRIVEEYDWPLQTEQHPHYIGVDFARHQNWTVITVLDAQGRLVDWWRKQHISWPRIQLTIEDMYDSYGGRVFVDGSRDNKIISDLENAGVPVEPINFTSQKKTQMIENLILAVEKGEITIPEIPQLISEMQAFEYDTTRAGNVSYHAPDEDGFFDDSVDSLALANWARVGAGRKPIQRGQKTAHVSKASWM